MENEVLDILDKWEFFLGQRAGRELWADKPKEVQEKDIADFNRDIKIVRAAIDPESLRPKGRWVVIEHDKENKRVFVECECGAIFKLTMFDFGLCYNYCPNCGKKMEV